MTTALEPALVAVPLMDAMEARDAIDGMRGDLDQIDTSLGSFRQRALDFAEREGWKALGYGGVAEAIRSELGAQYSKSHLSRLLGAAGVERVLQLPMGNSVPERVLREIGTLADPEAQRQAWEVATTAAGGATPTTAQARAAVAEVRGPAVDEATFQDAQRRFRALGWRLERHGAWFKLTRPDGTLYATTPDLAPQLNTLGTLEAVQAMPASAPAPAPSCAQCGGVWGAPGSTIVAGGTFVCATCLRKKAPAPAAEPVPLPPLPDTLRHTWTRWQNEDGTIGMRHASGYKLAGTDAAALERQAADLARPLAELADHGWRVYYDPGAEGRSDLHPYTAGHEEHDAISARSLPELALTAWKARLFEDDAPNMPDDVVDALYLAGYDWTGTAWVRGLERVDEDANLAELRYQLGLTAADDMPHLPDGWEDARRRATRIGLYLGMDMTGMFSLSNLSRSISHKTGKWADLLTLLTREEEKAARQPPPAAAAPLRQPCTSCGATLLNGHFDGQCGPCYRGERLTLADDPRARAGQLLAALAKAVPRVPACRQIEELSQAIADLNECREGEEARHWLAVGWALLDRAPEEATR